MTNALKAHASEEVGVDILIISFDKKQSKLEYQLINGFVMLALATLEKLIKTLL